MAAVANIRSSFKEYFYDDTDLQYIYEDEQCVAFDITRNIQAPTHFLVVPKKVIPRLSQACPEDEKLLGHLLTVCRRVAKMKSLHDTGFRVVMNEGPQGGPSADQLHFHVMGHLLVVAKNVAIQKGLSAGYHLIVDEDHKAMKFKAVHIFGRALHHMVWPIGPGCRL